jgi:hypothetical protein
MREPTTTLVMAAGSYRPLLVEAGSEDLFEEEFSETFGGFELLAEDGSVLYAEPTGAAVTLTATAPTVALVMALTSTSLTLLAEDGTTLLAEDGTTLMTETVGGYVTLEMRPEV